MAGLKARITVDLEATLSRLLALSEPTDQLAVRAVTSFVDGTGAGQANTTFSDRRTVAASATDSIDLAGGITSPLGTPNALLAVKAILIKASEANGGNLRVGKGVANAFVGPFGAAAVGVTVAPGGVLLLVNSSAAGWTVTAGTGDILAVENLNAGASGDFDIVLIGVK